MMVVLPEPAGPEMNRFSLLSSLHRTSTWDDPLQSSDASWMLPYPMYGSLRILLREVERLSRTLFRAFCVLVGTSGLSSESKKSRYTNHPYTLVLPCLAP